jgi:putative membrane protein
MFGYQSFTLSNEGAGVELTDLALAILHHLAVFLLAGMLAAELALVRPGLAGGNLALVGRLDAAYGSLAGLIVLIGAGRVIFGLKGWEYYVYYWAFWAKMAAFVGVGLLSLQPTARIQRWRKQAAGAADYVVPDAEVIALRRFMRAEAVVLALVLVFAAVMARGIAY